MGSINLLYTGRPMWTRYATSCNQCPSDLKYRPKSPTGDASSRRHGDTRDGRKRSHDHTSVQTQLQRKAGSGRASASAENSGCYTLPELLYRMFRLLPKCCFSFMVSSLNPTTNKSITRSQRKNKKKT